MNHVRISCIECDTVTHITPDDKTLPSNLRPKELFSGFCAACDRMVTMTLAPLIKVRKQAKEYGGVQ